MRMIVLPVGRGLRLIVVTYTLNPINPVKKAGLEPGPSLFFEARRLEHPAPGFEGLRTSPGILRLRVQVLSLGPLGCRDFEIGIRSLGLGLEGLVLLESA